MNFNGKPPLFRAFFLLVALASHFQTAMAQDKPSEQSVRAVMVFNFLKFTEFPPEVIANTQQVRLCIAVRDARQVEALVALSGRKVMGRELIVARLSGQDGDCQVLYVDSRQRWNATEEQNLFRNALTISAYPGFAEDGGMIEIAVRDDGIRFDINLAEARRAGIHFSPQMLRLARQVHE